MKKIEKIGIEAAVIVGVLVGGFFSLPWIFGLFTKDIPTINDADVRLSKVILLDADNDYFDLIRARKALSLTDNQKKLLNDLVAGKTWDENQAGAMLRQNTEALNHFAVAAQRGVFQDVAFADPAQVSYDTQFLSHNDLLPIARLGALSALLHTRQGKNAEAIEQSLIIVRVGTAITNSQAPLVEYLIGLGIKKIGLDAMRKSISSAAMTPESLSRVIANLEQGYENEAGLEKAVRGEYTMLASIVEQVANGTLNFSDIAPTEEKVAAEKLSKRQNNFYFRPNKTKQLFADHARTLIANVRKPCGALVLPKADPSARSPLKLYFSDNAIGKLFTTVSFGSYDRMFTKKCEDDLLVGVTQLMLAMKLYQNKNGELPSSLTDLVPAYLPAVPQDPYGGKALRYDASKKILYSVGEDLIDGGGSEGDDWKKMADPTFPVAF